MSDNCAEGWENRKSTNRLIALLLSVHEVYDANCRQCRRCERKLRGSGHPEIPSNVSRFESM
jgi:hypothetical protein